MGSQQIQRVQKVGNSLGVVIPANVVRALGIQRGDHVSFAVYAENEICVRVLTAEELRKLKPNTIQYG